jgi:hypothetical protein
VEQEVGGDEPDRGERGRASGRAEDQMAARRAGVENWGRTKKIKAKEGGQG